MPFIVTVIALAAIISTLPPPSSAAPTARLIQTSEAFPSKSSPDRLVTSPLPLSPSPSPSLPTISLDPSTRFQALWGFGGAITDAAAHVFAQLKPELQVTCDPHL